MEPKTIGKFISVLRRANGMTQRELAEKLFVSDKTVSRWERDECAPDLSLIPVIADLFGVTADELIRGERKSEQKREQPDEKSNPRSEKQYRLLLQQRLTKYKNLTLISFGLLLLGLIGAMIANLGFTSGLVGFCVGAVFLVAAAICQVCFFNNAYLHTEDEENSQEILLFHTRLIRIAKNLAYIALVFFGAILPLLFCPSYTGLMTWSWIMFGAVAALCLLAVGVFTYEIILKKRWSERGLLYLSEREQALDKYRHGLLKRLTVIAASLTAVLLVGIVITRSIDIYAVERPEVIYNYEDFKSLMEGYSYIDAEGNRITEQLTSLDYEVFFDQKVDVVEKDPTGESEEPTEVCDAQGNLLCTYYDRNSSVRYVEFSFEESADGLPVKVYTQFTLFAAQTLVDNITAGLIVAIVLALLICVIVYLAKRTPKANI